jgi:hypothetical protein
VVLVSLPPHYFSRRPYCAKESALLRMAKFNLGLAQLTKSCENAERTEHEYLSSPYKCLWQWNNSWNIDISQAEVSVYFLASVALSALKYSQIPNRQKTEKPPCLGCRESNLGSCFFHTLASSKNQYGTLWRNVRVLPYMCIERRQTEMWVSKCQAVWWLLLVSFTYLLTEF